MRIGKVMIHRNTTRANALIEFTAIVTVIALLVLIAALTPYRGRAGAGKLDQAWADAQAIASAQRAVAEKHGVYVPLQVLDDLASEGEVKGSRKDYFNREPQSLRVVDVFAPVENQIGKQQGLAERVAEWSGPYFSAKRIYVGGSLSDLPVVSPQVQGPSGQGFVLRDYPLDPWGNAYRFYSPSGIIGSAAAKSDPATFETEAFSDGVLTTEEDRFDSFAVVSFGPDGQSDFVTNANDDVIYLMKD